MEVLDGREVIALRGDQVQEVGASVLSGVERRTESGQMTKLVLEV